MPWTAADAHSKTKKADSPTAQRQWSHVANEMLEKTGDDAVAIRAANSVISKRIPDYKASRKK